MSRFAVSPKVNAVDIAAPVEAALQTSEASDQDSKVHALLDDRQSYAVLPQDPNAQDGT